MRKQRSFLRSRFVPSLAVQQRYANERSPARTQQHLPHLDNGTDRVATLAPELEPALLAPLADGWQIRSNSLADLFREVEMIVWKLLLEPNLYVVIQRNDTNRFVQALVEQERQTLWMETVSDEFLGYDSTGPKYTASEIGSLARNRWQPPRTGDTPTPNWHRELQLTANGVPALASQLLVSTLIDTHHVRSPQDLSVLVGIAGHGDCLSDSCC